jgi:uncharacterized protein (TIGR03435 family)
MIQTLRGATLALAALWALFGQSAVTPAKFEVASVKPVASESREGADYRTFPGGRLTMTNLTLKTILREAYGVKEFQLSGGPPWFDRDHFDIEAKAGGPATRAEMMPMLQALLMDRFQLKVHRESKDGNVYALVVGKRGSKLKQASDGEQSFVRVARADPPERPVVTSIIYGQRANMSSLIERLSSRLRTPVLDRTGIKGDFNFKLEFAYDDTQPDSGPSLLSAIQDQLGLKLEAARGPIETLVVDHAERPSEN